MAKVIDVDEFRFAALLAKSASYGTRELGWSALADADLVKVGPKGYIHGWVFVGAPGAGTLVEHARHGTGKVTHRDEHGHVHVDFGGGKRHSFEHAGGAGPGVLSPRAKGTDAFSTHLDAATAANRRGDHAAAAGHYRQAAGATTHPHLASEMHQRADVAAAKVPGLRPSTASEFARTDISSAVHSHDREHVDFPETARQLDELSNGLRDGTVKIPDAANRLDRIVADHVARHGTENHTFQRLDMHARDMRSDPRIGALMKPAPKPRRKPKVDHLGTPLPNQAEGEARARQLAAEHLTATEAETDPEKRARLLAAARATESATVARDTGERVRGARRPAAEVTAERDRVREERRRLAEGKRHIQLALGARMRGNHDEANGHLEAAAALAPDEESRRRLLDARRGGSFDQPATEPKAPKPNKPGRGDLPRPAEAILADLRAARGKHAGHEVLAGLSKPQLETLSIAAHRPVRSGESGPQIRQRLVESFAGDNLQPSALSRAFEEAGAARVMPPKADAPQPVGQAERTPEKIDSEVRDATRQLQREPGGWVSLTDVRDRLGHIPRDQQDASLRRLNQAPDVHLVPENDQSSLTARDRAAALSLGGQPNHRISVRSTAPMPAGQADHVQQVRDALGRAGTRAEARVRLAGLKKPQLTQLARDLGVSARTGNKKQLIDDLVEWAVGRRLDAEAMSRIGQVR